ncbi:MAG: hypothetical protein ACTSRZ_11825 [Promethearchaeota archaeon]
MLYFIPCQGYVRGVSKVLENRCKLYKKLFTIMRSIYNRAMKPRPEPRPDIKKCYEEYIKVLREKTENENDDKFKIILNKLIENELILGEKIKDGILKYLNIEDTNETQAILEKIIKLNREILPFESIKKVEDDEIKIAIDRLRDNLSKGMQTSSKLKNLYAYYYNLLTKIDIEKLKLNEYYFNSDKFFNVLSEINNVPIVIIRTIYAIIEKNKKVDYEQKYSELSDILKGEIGDTYSNEFEFLRHYRILHILDNIDIKDLIEIEEYYLRSLYKLTEGKDELTKEEEKERYANFKANFINNCNNLIKEFNKIKSKKEIKELIEKLRPNLGGVQYNLSDKNKIFLENYLKSPIYESTALKLVPEEDFEEVYKKMVSLRINLEYGTKIITKLKTDTYSKFIKNFKDEIILTKPFLSKKRDREMLPMLILDPRISFKSTDKEKILYHDIAEIFRTYLNQQNDNEANLDKKKNIPLEVSIPRISQDSVDYCKDKLNKIKASQKVSESDLEFGMKTWSNKSIRFHVLPPNKLKKLNNFEVKRSLLYIKKRKVVINFTIKMQNVVHNTNFIDKFRNKIKVKQGDILGLDFNRLSKYMIAASIIPKDVNNKDWKELLGYIIPSWTTSIGKDFEKFKVKTEKIDKQLSLCMRKLQNPISFMKRKRLHNEIRLLYTKKKNLRRESFLYAGRFLYFMIKKSNVKKVHWDAVEISVRGKRKRLAKAILSMPGLSVLKYIKELIKQEGIKVSLIYDTPAPSMYIPTFRGGKFKSLKCNKTKDYDYIEYKGKEINRHGAASLMSAVLMTLS